MILKIGQGIDVHKLGEGTPLIIGGVSIPHTKGSIGHSDGDVLYHAITDACLGAMALGDIGKHFPSSNKKLKNINSKYFMEKVNSLIINKGYKICNIDSTIILQTPHINNYIQEMIENISKIFSILNNQVSIKATTTDKLGFIGAEKGIAAMSIIMMSQSNNEN